MKILAVHQGFELYGSDRVFARVLEQFRTNWPNAEIVACLPKEGALSALLKSSGFSVKIEDLWVLRKSRGILLLVDLFRLPRSILRAYELCRPVDVVYVSTAVIFDYMVAMRFVSARKFIHVHELPSKFVSRILAFFLEFSQSTLIHISQATRAAFNVSSSVRQEILPNCADDHGVVPQNDASLDRPLRVLLIGRINGWKGQDLLIESLSLLAQEDRRRLEVRLLGGVFGDQKYDLVLKEKIDRLGMGGYVDICPFQDNPSEHYRWADVVAVPSRKPEPFGLVAIEGMSFGRPVIAADHGGLADIVEHMVDGLKFEPNDPAALAAALRLYIGNREVLSQHGMHARRTYERSYAPAQFNERLRDVLG